ncbi:MAG: hypothetical protein ACMXYB_02030 [Candidatus Woesearchaeota archaeon]
MKLIKQEGESKYFLIEHFDDIWVLSKYILAKDIVCSKTTRKIAIGSDKTKQVTKTIFVELQVKSIEIVSEDLRIQGIIANETEFTTKGSHHSFLFSIGDTIEIKEFQNGLQKPQFLQKLLQRVLNSTKNKFLILLNDVDSLLVARCSLFSIEILIEKSRLGSKKYFSTHKQATNIEEMYETIKDISFNDYSFVVFAGVGNYKVFLKDVILRQHSNLKTVILNATEVSSSQISQIIDELKEKNLLEDINNSYESKKVELFLQELATTKKVVYGIDNVLEAVRQGSVKELLVTSSFYNEFLNSYFNEIQLLEQMGAEVSIINSNSHNGSIIQGMGDVVGFLRF